MTGVRAYSSVMLEEHFLSIYHPQNSKGEHRNSPGALWQVGGNRCVSAGVTCALLYQLG